MSRDTYLIVIGTNPEIFALWPGWIRVLFFFILAYIQSKDVISEIISNLQLRQKNKQLKDNFQTSTRQLNQLRGVISSFLEYSDIYRNRVKNQLQLNEDYLCIVKSSEGLSSVFEKMEEKSQLPFTRVLASFPGAVKPFERMGLFLIPTRSLPNLRGKSLRRYVDREIIPRVRRQRTRFLDELPPRLRREAEEFYFKYIAFFVSKGNIAHDVRNRKFNHDFNSFIVNEQIGGDFAALKTELEEVVKTRDLLQLINWSAFVNLNKEQSKLLRNYKEPIYQSLSHRSLARFTDLAAAQPEVLFAAIWPVVRRAKTTRKKIENMCKKIIRGASNTSRILRENNINF